MIDEEHQVEGMQSSSVGTDATSSAEHGAQVAGSEQVNAEEAVGLPLDQVDFSDIDDTTASASDGGDYAKLATLEGEIQSLKAQLEDRTGQYVRLVADFENYRKRTQREKDEFEQKIKCDTINELLPVVDNFERARSQIKPQTEPETTIHKSYQSVYKQLVDCLKRVGVSPMRAEGSEFDPALHEAVMRQPTADHPDGTVMEELRRGYMLGDRVLRHALVKVAAPPEPELSSEEAEQSSSDS
jgi:molecular chaperone GrpE